MKYCLNNLTIASFFFIFFPQNIHSQNKDSVSFHIVEKSYIFDWDAKKERLVESIYIQCKFTNFGDNDIVIAYPICSSGDNPYLLKLDTLIIKSFFVSPIGSEFSCTFDSAQIKSKKSKIFYIDISDILRSRLNNPFETYKSKTFTIAFKYDFGIIANKIKQRKVEDKIPERFEWIFNSSNNRETAWTNEVKVIIAERKEARKIRKERECSKKCVKYHFFITL